MKVIFSEQRMQRIQTFVIDAIIVIAVLGVGLRLNAQPFLKLVYGG